MRYWLCLTNIENWKTIIKKDIYGFNEQNKKYINIIKNKDKIVMYVIPKKIGGIFEIINTECLDKIHFRDGYYPYKIKVKKEIIPDDFIEINDKIISNLKLFKDSLRWGTVLMGRSIKELDKEDYEYLKSLIEHASKK